MWTVVIQVSRTPPASASEFHAFCPQGIFLVLYLSSSLLFKNLKFKIHRTIILPVLFMGVKLGR